MQLIFGQERQPVDTFLLVLAEIGLDWYRDIVFGDLTAVEKLRQELSFDVTFSEEIIRETWRVWQTSLNNR